MPFKLKVVLRFTPPTSSTGSFFLRILVTMGLWDQFCWKTYIKIVFVFDTQSLRLPNLCCSTIWPIIPKKSLFSKTQGDIGPSRGIGYHPDNLPRNLSSSPVRKGLPEKLAFHPWRRTGLNSQNNECQQEVIAYLLVFGIWYIAPHFRNRFWHVWCHSRY